MRRIILFALMCALALGASGAAQQGALQAAATTLGAANVKTLQFTGSGREFTLGQNPTSSEAWPPVTVKNFVASINYDDASMRMELLREMGTVMPPGGGQAFFGEQRQIRAMNGNYAWTVVMPANTPAGSTPPAAPAPGAQLERMLFLWATPQGFVKAAMANNATTRNVRGGTEVSLTVGGRYRMTGLINAQGQVERVSTFIDHPIVGDMPVVTTYTGYRDFSGVTFPSRIMQTQDGHPSLELTISAAVANPVVDASVPDNVRNAVTPPTQVTVTKVAEGVFHLTGGTHHSVAVEMRDHIVLMDVPLTEQRALAVVAKAKETIPNKPIRFLVTSHHHWDHMGGIRTAIDEGATIVTHESNKAFLERVAKAPHTIVPDRLAASKKAVKIQTVGDRGRLTDGTRTIELHRVADLTHAGDMLLMYLPAEKVLAEADVFTPPPQAGTPLLPPQVPLAKALYDNIQRLKLDVQVIAPMHGPRLTNVAEVGRAGGVQGTN